MPKRRSGHSICVPDNPAVFTVFCYRCGETRSFYLPVTIPRLMAWCKAFQKKHRGCKETAKQEPERETAT